MADSSTDGLPLPLDGVRLRALVQHSPAAFALFDLDLRYLDASLSWRRHLAGGTDELRGKRHEELFPGRNAPWLAACERCLAEEKNGRETLRCEASDGAPRWFAFSVSPWHGEDGSVHGVCVFAEERTRMLELQAQQSRTESIVRTAMDAIISMDEQHRIIQFNHAAEITFRCPAAEALGSPLERFLPSEYREAHHRYVRHFGATGETTRSMIAPKRLMALRGDGVCFPIEATISKSGAEGERIYTVILRDISERQRAEEAMLRAEKLALAGRMAGALAHEINNPLASLTNALYLIGSQELPEDIRGYLSLASSELQRVVHLTQQSLGFYRESGQPGPVSVPELVDSAVAMLEGKIRRGGNHIERRWKTSRRILGVAGELRQVIANLLANSLDASTRGGTIWFLASNALMLDGREAVRLTVVDNGQGIPPADRPHIFEPFYTTKGDFGTGLGLWVSKQLVDKQGGRLHLRTRDAEPGRGTAIAILLPAVPCIAPGAAR